MAMPERIYSLATKTSERKACGLARCSFLDCPVFDQKEKRGAFASALGLGAVERAAALLGILLRCGDGATGRRSGDVGGTRGHVGDDTRGGAPREDTPGGQPRDARPESSTEGQDWGVVCEYTLAKQDTASLLPGTRRNEMKGELLTLGGDRLDLSDNLGLDELLEVDALDVIGRPKSSCWNWSEARSKPLRTPSWPKRSTSWSCWSWRIALKSKTLFWNRPWNWSRFRLFCWQSSWSSWRSRASLLTLSK